MTNNNCDFGFNDSEFEGNDIPYAQFLNISENFGIAVTSKNAAGVKLELINNWHIVEHQFSDGTTDNLLVTKQPRLLILNRSQTMMSNDFETIAFDKSKCIEGNYKAFSYAIIWFLDENNKPISELPLRLKCSGFSGTTFLQHYSYFNKPNTFCKEFFSVYQTLTNDRAISKNDIFYAHAVYQPILIRETAKSSVNGKSSMAVKTDSFLKPTKRNFPSLIIKNGSDTSNRIKELISTTKAWLKPEKSEAIADDEHHQSFDNVVSNDSELESADIA